jgi:hypothetical protein
LTKRTRWPAAGGMAQGLGEVALADTDGPAEDHVSLLAHRGLWRSWRGLRSLVTEPFYPHLRPQWVRRPRKAQDRRKDDLPLPRRARPALSIAAWSRPAGVSLGGGAV